MAEIVDFKNSFGMPLTIRRENAMPLDFSFYFDNIDDAKAYTNGSDTTQGVAYVGQLIQVNEGSATEPKITVYKIANKEGQLSPIYDEDNIAAAGLENIGFEGELPVAGTSLNVKKGHQYVLTRELTNGDTHVAEPGDYLVYKGADTAGYVIPADNAWRSSVVNDWVMLEQNLTNAITGITPTTTTDGKYVKKIKQEGHILEIMYEEFPIIEYPLAYNVCRRYTGYGASETVSPGFEQLTDIITITWSKLDKIYEAIGTKGVADAIKVYMNGVLLNPSYYTDQGNYVGDYEVVYVESTGINIIFNITDIFNANDIVAISFVEHKEH